MTAILLEDFSAVAGLMERLQAVLADVSADGGRFGKLVQALPASAVSRARAKEPSEANKLLHGGILEKAGPRASR